MKYEELEKKIVKIKYSKGTYYRYVSENEIVQETR